MTFKEISVRGVSPHAKLLLLALIGIKSLGQELPSPLSFPASFRKGSKDVMDFFEELSRKGYIIGEPKSYRINHSKVKYVKSEKVGDKISDLLGAFQEACKRHREQSPRRSGQDLVQLRYLKNKYSSGVVRQEMEIFFTSPQIAARAGQIGVKDFFHFASERLKKAEKFKP